MTYHDLIIERDDALVRVTLNRPASLNTLSARLLRELRDAARALRRDPEVRVVILGSAGGRFSAGLDLKDPEVEKMLSGTLAERRERVVLGPEACLAWEEIRAVTIAALEGFCIGGGVSLAISCDFRIMGESAYMRIPEVDLGLNYSWGSIPRLIRLAGPARAKRMIFLCEQVAAPTCLEWGLCEQVVPDGSAGDAAARMAEKLLAKPPIPLFMTKETVTALTTAMDRAGSHMDADQFLLTTYSEDHKEGLAAFRRKRPPVFKGR